ncbi:MAG: arginine--tRNA ligase [Bacteroidales bacterium]|nr:arginine--tRNA ligase [Bacteroidales bacterium]
MEILLAEKVRAALTYLYNVQVDRNEIQVEKTKKDIRGDYTVVVFPLLKYSGKSPNQMAGELGSHLLTITEYLASFEVIGGFLNLAIKETFWKEFFTGNLHNEQFGFKPLNSRRCCVIEYSSPNTNKPLHLGHIRNNLLGWSIAEILKANGKSIVKISLINDRGIHICKSMLAWQKWGHGETPDNTGIKGDHLIGKYYVMFDKEHKKQIEELVHIGFTEEDAYNQAQLMLEAKEMLKKWEDAEDDVIELWRLMNSWVLDGFNETYKRLGIDFDKVNHESVTYLQGKEIVKEGLESGVFFKKSDGSVWVDLSEDGLDEKLLLRADGTSVYITQDLGTAQRRHDEFFPEKLLYVVGNEQIYHFNVLRLIMKKLGRDWYDKIHHLSYGMVELPHGRMKSREGTVVDADDLMDEMYQTALKTTRELGKISDFEDPELHELFDMVSMAALKYYILKVDPKKNMMFNPEESIDFDGNTGPFIQYTYARIRSVLRKAEKPDEDIRDTFAWENITLTPKETGLLKCLYDFPAVVENAGANLSPALIANYSYDLARTFNHYYQDTPIFKGVEPGLAEFRMALSRFTGKVLSKSMRLLGIKLPEKM